VFFPGIDHIFHYQQSQTGTKTPT